MSQTIRTRVGRLVEPRKVEVVPGTRCSSGCSTTWPWSTPSSSRSSASSPVSGPGGPETGDHALVVGCGFMGLLCVAGLRSVGLASLTAVDLLDERLELARQIGATATLNPRRDDVLARLQEITGGHGADVAMEASTVPVGFELASKALRRGRPRPWPGASSRCTSSSPTGSGWTRSAAASTRPSPARPATSRVSSSRSRGATGTAETQRPRRPTEEISADTLRLTVLSTSPRRIRSLGGGG